MLAYEQLCLAVSRCEKFSDFFIFFYESFLVVFLQENFKHSECDFSNEIFTPLSLVRTLLPPFRHSFLGPNLGSISFPPSFHC